MPPRLRRRRRGRRGGRSEARSAPATDGRSGRHRPGSPARHDATAHARHPPIEASSGAQQRLPRSANPVPAPPLARSSPTRHGQHHGRRSRQGPRWRRPVRGSCGEHQTPQNRGIARQAPERLRQAAAAPPPPRARSHEQNPIRKSRRSTHHPRARRPPGCGRCFVRGDVQPRSSCLRKDRAVVVRSSDHDARSRHWIQSASDDTNRKISRICRVRDGGGPTPSRRSASPRSYVSACSMTARGWQSTPPRFRSGKCRRKFQLRRSRLPEHPARGCSRD